MKVERFEDLIAWQKARELNRSVYQLTSSARFRSDFSLRDQIRRCSISIMANIAEGFDRFRPTEFRQFLSIAKSSCAELRSHLHAACDTGFFNEDEMMPVYDRVIETSRIIAALRSAVDRRCRGSQPEP